MDLHDQKVSAKGLKYVQWLVHNQKVILLFILLLSLGGVFFASKLYLKPSFSALLPEKLPSVKQLNKVIAEAGGTGLLLVGIESPSFQANRDFSDKLVAEIKKLDDGRIRDIEHHFKETRKYVERFGLFYLRVEDLSKLRDRLKKEILEKAEKKKDGAFADFLGLEEDVEKKEADKPTEPEVESANELSATLDPGIQRILEYPKDYLASSDGKLVVVGLRTAGSSLALGESKKLVADVRAIIDQLDPLKFNKEMTVNFAGNVQRSIDEVETVRRDIVDTAVLLVVLTLTLLYIFFQSLSLVGLLTFNLIVGLAWTLGFAQLSVGYLNTLTAFLSSLVVGTGINYSCILISRFLEEKRAGFGTRDALAQTIGSCFLPTLVGSGTTAVSFLALFLADNKGFSEFALIGGFGITFCWITAFTLLPILIWHLDRRINLVGKNLSNAHRIGVWVSNFGASVMKHSTVVIVLLAISTVASVVIGVKFLEDPFEYDFRKLGNSVSLSKQGASFLHNRIQTEVYRTSMIPAVVLFDNVDQSRHFCEVVSDKVNAVPKEERNFQGCLSMHKLLPPAAALQDETPYKVKLRNEVRELMGSKWLKYSDSKLAEIMLNIHKNSENYAPTENDLPDQLKRRFKNLKGQDAALGMVYSDNSKPLEDGKNLLAYTQMFGQISMPGELGEVRASGENFVLADLLRSIKIDGPKTTVVSLIGVLLLCAFLGGGLRGGVLMGTCVILATVWLLGIQSIIEMKFNFLNFIAYPLTFGIGVDYSINIFQRYREQGFKDFKFALQTTGVAVILCSLTTILGYLTLFEASNQALKSFAKVALIGELTSLVAAFVFLPALLSFIGRKNLK